MADERASIREEVALLDQFVALGLTVGLGVVVVEEVEQQLDVTFQHAQVDWME